MSSPTVTLFLKPYVAHWLQQQFNCPVKLPRKSNYKTLLRACLAKQFRPSREFDLEAYPQPVDFVVTEDDLLYHGVSVQLQLQHFLNDFFEAEIKNELFMYILAHISNGMTVDKAVMMYQVDFGFTEATFTRDNIRQAYFRKKSKMRKIFGGTVTKTNTNATAISN